MISVGASSMTRRTSAIAAATAIPIAMPAAACQTNDPAALSSENVPVNSAASATL